MARRASSRVTRDAGTRTAPLRARAERGGTRPRRDRPDGEGLATGPCPSWSRGPRSSSRPSGPSSPRSTRRPDGSCETALRLSPWSEQHSPSFATVLAFSDEQVEAHSLFAASVFAFSRTVVAVLRDGLGLLGEQVSRLALRGDGLGLRRSAALAVLRDGLGLLGGAGRTALALRGDGLRLRRGAARRSRRDGLGLLGEQVEPTRSSRRRSSPWSQRSTRLPFATVSPSPRCRSNRTRSSRPRSSPWSRRSTGSPSRRSWPSPRCRSNRTRSSRPRSSPSSRRSTRRPSRRSWPSPRCRSNRTRSSRPRSSPSSRRSTRCPSRRSWPSPSCGSGRTRSSRPRSSPSSRRSARRPSRRSWPSRRAGRTALALRGDGLRLGRGALAVLRDGLGLLRAAGRAALALREQRRSTRRPSRRSWPSRTCRSSRTRSSRDATVFAGSFSAVEQHSSDFLATVWAFLVRARRAAAALLDGDGRAFAFSAAQPVSFATFVALAASVCAAWRSRPASRRTGRTARGSQRSRCRGRGRPRRGSGGGSSSR